MYYVPLGELFGKEGVLKSKKLHPYYEQFARENGCDYVESADEDCVHLIVEGHYKIAKVIGDKIEKMKLQ